MYTLIHTIGKSKPLEALREKVSIVSEVMTGIPL